jgi:CHAD domain-containing protein
LETGDWAKSRGKLREAKCQRAVEPFAAEILSARIKKVRKKARQMRHLAPRQRHKLRIAIKKLRYATEFFSPLFKDKRQRRLSSSFQKRLEQLQDCLGTLNDIIVHQKLVADMIHSSELEHEPGRRTERAFAAGLVSGRQQSSAQTAVTAAGRAAKRLSKLRPFWK